MAESVTEESTKGKVSCKSADSAVISSAEDVSSIEESIESVEENAQKLAEYEELFKHRYTMEDPKYAATVNRPPDSPAIVDPWGGKPQRNFDYTRFEVKILKF